MVKDDFWLSLAGLVLRVVIFLIDLRKRLLSDKEKERLLSDEEKEPK